MHPKTSIPRFGLTDARVQHVGVCLNQGHGGCGVRGWVVQRAWLAYHVGAILW